MPVVAINTRNRILSMHLRILRRIAFISILLCGCVCVLLFSFVHQKLLWKRKPKNGRLWFFKDGAVYPEVSRREPHLFPHESSGDRIVEQLMYVPVGSTGFYTRRKVILTYNGLDPWKQGGGSRAFRGCPVSSCMLTYDRTTTLTADAILYKDVFIHPRVPRPKKQIWILYILESPYFSDVAPIPDFIDWTATYRHDSEIVTPYERWTYYDPQVKYIEQGKNYAENKTKKVAWLVSNCKTPNNRFKYVQELAKHISVDVYGVCGTLRCRDCHELLDRDYKFYLAFENSNCVDYITEKLFVNALGHNTLPIVMGARPEDYRRSAPEGSYLHVDSFASPADLAAYLHKLDDDDDLYNSYFQWKGTGEFINTYFWCRLCAMLHAPYVSRHSKDTNTWWRGPGTCTTQTWNDTYI